MKSLSNCAIWRISPEDLRELNPKRLDDLGEGQSASHVGAGRRVFVQDGSRHGKRQVHQGGVQEAPRRRRRGGQGRGRLRQGGGDRQGGRQG